MMDSEPLEPFLPIIAALAMLVGESCLELVTEDMPSDKDRANWTEEEKEALVAFLVDEKIAGKMGDGSFKSTTWSAAAAHINKKFPKQKAPV
ncbi:hypothetical protein M404DRAFT_27067 [Pisolithus tinctorius Marx 270]|uniref:Myb/SANT-like domain-containing protein n=1 Tax=Pisolithus tinctorius Marx 270 TaxID=870435 RepID=A0A0C3NRE8_PISTI|nr:hypothetical protein M404DRAFT_27067 [Pisolithus tinctorius Marx 270]